VEGVIIANNESGMKKVRRGKRFTARKEKQQEHEDREDAGEHHKKNSEAINVEVITKDLCFLRRACCMQRLCNV
jgi:hypothetical protein